jgi:hypothetical protein
MEGQGAVVTPTVMFRADIGLEVFSERACRVNIESYGRFTAWRRPARSPWDL